MIQDPCVCSVCCAIGALRLEPQVATSPRATLLRRGAGCCEPPRRSHASGTSRSIERSEQNRRVRRSHPQVRPAATQTLGTLAHSFSHFCPVVCLRTTPIHPYCPSTFLLTRCGCNLFVLRSSSGMLIVRKRSYSTPCCKLSLDNLGTSCSPRHSLSALAEGEHTPARRAPRSRLRAPDAQVASKMHF